ncbi:helix-turn-helix domain-containing protein [Desulfonatronovibrio magnus]|uniref:helix-turn-helix domain-containing protein n=1 Tax=Desulfonatronovibrio magnus TaxID=698827 RepID=UPI0005EB0630
MIAPSQIRAARALLRWSQKDLSEKSGVSLRAVNKFESEECDPRLSTVNAMQHALQNEGIIFVTEMDRVGVFLRFKQ